MKNFKINKDEQIHTIVPFSVEYQEDFSKRWNEMLKLFGKGNDDTDMEVER